MACGAAQIEQASRCKHDDAMAVREDEAVDLRLDVLNLDAWAILELCHLNLVVEVANVADDSIVLHLLHVLQCDDLEVARGSREDVDLAHHGVQGHDLEALHASLQSVDGVDLRDQHARTGTLQGESAPLADITVAANQRALAADHHVRGAHDAIGQRVSASVDIVELGLGHAIVDVDSREEQLALGCHLLQPHHTRRGLLADALALGRHARVLGLVSRDGVLQQLQDALELRVVSARRIRQGAILGELFLKLLALVDQHRGITAVVHELVAAVLAGHRHHLLGAPPVLRQGLTLPGEDRGGASLGDGGRGVVLGAEDVAGAPTHLGTQGRKGLDEHARLNGHVQGAVDVHALEGLSRSILDACGHKAGHLDLRQGQLLAAELGQAHVLHFRVSHGCSCFCCF
mmetsp:Transcript_46588/g.118141  ORF Transcript_46588/g.118141 Transcript_46588/m.118141 type:complete len:403 (-) Transcript_46588:61-1269(-)